MGRRRYTAVHMRCTRTTCRKRFKAVPQATNVCPACGGNAKPDPWAAKKPWNDRLCGCNGLVYMPEKDYTAHRRGSKGCLGEAPTDNTLPGDGQEYPF